MLNFNDNKDISTIETQIIKNEKQINSALLELFNNQYKAPKSLKGDKDSIDFNDLEQEIGDSVVTSNNALNYEYIDENLLEQK